MVDGFERFGPHLLQQLIDDFDIVRLGDEIGDGLGYGGTDAFDIVELGIGLAPAVAGRRKHGVAEGLDAAIGAREQPPSDLTDMRDAERIDEVVELHRTARLYCREQLRRRGLPPPFPGLEPRRGAPVASGKSEDVLRRLDQPVVVEGLDVLLAKPVDVEGVARHEMLEPLDPLRRADQAAGAAPDRILFAGDGIDLAHRVAAAGWTDSRKAKSFRALRPLTLNHPDNLRNDVAGALDDHRVSDAHVFP